MGEVVSLQDYRFHKAISGISQIYCNDPAVFAMYSAEMDKWYLLKHLMALDAQLEHLDKLVFNESGEINMPVVHEKNRINQIRLDLIKESNEKGS